METLKRCYRGWIDCLRYGQSVFLLAMRVLIGVGFMSAGWGKLSNISDTAGYFADLGIPLPTLNAYLAGSAETFGGLFLILGAASRIMTLPLIGTMIVALGTQHKDVFDGMWTAPISFIQAFVKSAPFPYLATALLVLLFGPGLFSVDGLLKRFVFDPKRPHGPPRAAVPLATDSLPQDERVRGSGASGFSP